MKVWKLDKILMKIFIYKFEVSHLAIKILLNYFITSNEKLLNMRNEFFARKEFQFIKKFLWNLPGRERESEIFSLIDSKKVLAVN